MIHNTSKLHLDILDDTRQELLQKLIPQTQDFVLGGGTITLKEIIVIAEDVYKALFNSKLFLEQLVYFKDLPDFDIESVGNASIPTPETIKQYLEDIVATYLEISSK